jgi:hypothetical protein
MVYAVPASKKSHKQNRFEFTVPGSKKTYSIPLAKYMSVGQVEVMSKKGDDLDLTDLLSIFNEDATAGAAEAVRKLDQEQLDGLMSAWQTESGISVGESSASEPTS